MPFDWNRYLDLAREWQGSTDEAYQRSAISRAYYCVFHAAKTYATQNLGYEYRPDNPAHQQLWRHFDGRGTTLKAVYSKGMTLKRYRQDADYDADAAIPAVSTAIQTAENALTYLDQLSKQASN